MPSLASMSCLFCLWSVVQQLAASDTQLLQTLPNFYPCSWMPSLQSAPQPMREREVRPQPMRSQDRVHSPCCRLVERQHRICIWHLLFCHKLPVLAKILQCQGFYWKQARAFRGDQAKIKKRRTIRKVNKQEQVKAVKCQFMVLCSKHQSCIWSDVWPTYMNRNRRSPRGGVRGGLEGKGG